MRMSLLAIFTLLCFCLAARADDLFVFKSGSDTLTFTLPSSPIPSTAGEIGFELSSVETTFDGHELADYMIFFNTAFRGGFGDLEYSEDGPQLFTGTTESPTFIPGTYDLTGEMGEWPDGTLTITDQTAITPEPSSFLLLGTGMLGVAGALRKRFA